jgi:hypothetical protein
MPTAWLRPREDITALTLQKGSVLCQWLLVPCLHEQRPGQCTVKRAGDAPVVHVLDLCHVMLADIVVAKISWFSEEAVAADLELYT